MALEQQLSLRSNPHTVDGGADGATNGAELRPQATDGGEEGAKTPRLPRWTRQEILVLIQGKRDAENRVRGGRASRLPFGSAQGEPKWASVSSYCKKHGVNRGPVQCRKRWSNLAGDYKKIKEWESQIREETESFWVMRNDLRRERKLPGFFDKEVYDILDAGSQAPALALALAPAPENATPMMEEQKDRAGDEPEGEPEQHLFDSGRSAAADDGLFSDFEQEDAGCSPVKEAAGKDFPLAPPATSVEQYQPLLRGCDQVEPQPNTEQDTTGKTPPASNPEIGSTSQGKKKRKRSLTADGEEESLQYQLIDVLERNGKMLTAQLEVQNTNFQLDRDQRRDHAHSLVAVLNKLADALGRIADKL